MRCQYNECSIGVICYYQYSLFNLWYIFSGGFAGGPPVATSYKVTSGILTETKPAAPPSGTSQVYVGKAGEAKTLPAMVEAFKIPVCVECGTSIR